MLAIEKYIAHERARGGLPGIVTLDKLGRQFVEGFAGYRRADGIADATISRELRTLRAAINWAAEEEMIGAKPHIPKLQGLKRLRTRPRQLAYTLPQLAALLDAAWARESRRHVHLFIIAMLASHARTEAILECDLDRQQFDGVIDWLGSDRDQTKKRRQIVPIGPTFATWLEGRTGKLIRYRVPRKPDSWADPAVPEFYERPTWEIIGAFKRTVLAAGAAHPSLGLRRPVLGPDGLQLTRTRRDYQPGQSGRQEITEPLWEAVGSPNTLRHTIHTQLSRIGVPEAQIDAAAGHATQGTGAHYNHFNARRDFREFLEGVEQLFDELRHYTTAHLRTHNGPKIIDLGQIRAAKPA